MGLISRASAYLRSTFVTADRLASVPDTPVGREIGGGRSALPPLSTNVDKSEFSDLIVGFQDEWSVKRVISALRSHDNGSFTESGYLVDNMLRDDRIASCLETRVMGLQGLPCTQTPANDSDAAKEVANALNTDWPLICPPRVKEEALEWEAMMGFALFELVWNTSGKRWIPVPKLWHPSYIYYRHDLRKYVAIAAEGQVYITPGDGKWLLFSRHASYRAWMRGGLRALTLPWFLRQFAYRDWGRFNEVHGLPIKQANVPMSASDPDKRAFFRQVANLGAAGVLMAPNNKDNEKFALELISAANSESASSFERALQNGNEAINLRLLGQNRSGGTGSSAAFSNDAEVADNVRSDYTRADGVAFDMDFKQQVARAYTEYNFGDELLTPSPTHDAKPPEDKVKNSQVFVSVMDALTKASQIGLADSIVMADVVEQYALPIKPDAKVTAPAPTPAPGTGGAPPSEGKPAESITAPKELSQDGYGDLPMSAVTVIVRNGKFAAIRSNKHNLAVELPGGKAEPGETPRQAAARECFEECGLRPTNLRLLYAGMCNGFLCHTFFADTFEGELKGSTEGEAFWATKEEILGGTYGAFNAEWMPYVLGELATMSLNPPRREPKTTHIDGQTYVDTVADHAIKPATKAFRTGILDVVKAAVSRAKNYEELRMHLLHSFHDLDPQEFQSILNGAAHLAIGAGAFTARKEAE